MKTIKYIAAALCTASLAACNDFLTEDVRGTQNLDIYFLNEEEVSAFTSGCYNNLTFNGWWQIQNPWMVFEATTDDCWAGNTSQECDFYNLTEFRGNSADNGEISNFWQYRYKGILNCNVGMSRTAAAPLDEAVRSRYYAEMQFLRAYFYFDLVKNFGGVPLITTFTMPEELAGTTRATSDVIYDFVEQELAAAAAALPKRSEYAAEDMGRATQGAAYGMLGKAQLYRGKWSEAKASLAKVIDSGEYQLLTDFGQVWNLNYNNSKEGVFEIQQAFDETYAIGSSLPTITGARNGPGDGWSWFQPTSDLENAYIAAGDTERLRWTIIKCGCTEIAGEKDFDKFIANNDNLDKNTVARWEEMFGFEASKCYIIRPDQHKSARLIRKFFIPLEDRPAIYNIDKIPLNYRLLRYADVLLMYAEACNELGEDAEAREALNKVRSRVGLVPVTASGDELRQAIRLERRLELAFEGSRLYDIRRWKDADGQPVIASLMGPEGTFVKYNAQMLDPYEANNQIESSVAKGRGFRLDRDLVFPIPIYEVEHSNGTIEQNPNY